MTIKTWHLGVVLLIVLLAMAMFVGRSLAPKGSSDGALLEQELQQKDLTIAQLQTRVATLQARDTLLQAAQLGFTDRSDETAAAANVRSLIPSVESYNADNVPAGTNDPDAVGAPGLCGAGSATDSGYAGMCLTELKGSYDQAIPATDYVNDSGAGSDAAGVTATVAPSATTYCVYSQVGNWFAYKLGPAGIIKQTTTAASVCT